jgi:asparagine synthase (glutamine-hydrolysing)
MAWDEQEKLLSDDVIEATGGHPQHDRPIGRFPLEDALLWYMRFYLGDGILTKVDRASMSVSLEVRAPFLDRDLVEYVSSLPPNWRIRPFKMKYLLKKIMKGRLPNIILKRTKKGFGLPVSKWLQTSMKNLTKEMLSEKILKEHGLFSRKYVKAILREHLEGIRDNGKQLWALLLFQLWYESWMK